MKNYFIPFLLSCLTYSLQAQIFGRNKPVYQNFDFQVVETPHFKIHHYLKNAELTDKLASTSEQWYQNHKNIFTQDINFKIPSFFTMIMLIFNKPIPFQGKLVLEQAASQKP
ncbi:MAG: hypothetical protein IPK25_00990 [Saprospiraceae bacterium]|nr:hypothetical protein [Saprospiraceae bacterium]